MEKNIILSGIDKNSQVLIEKLKNYKIDNLVISYCCEWEYTSSSVDFNKLIDYINEKNIIINYMVGGSSNNSLLHDSKNSYFKNVNLLYWETFMFPYTFREKKIYSNFSIKTSNDLKYFFVSLNNRPHCHRCLMIDLLEEYKLIEKSLISWNIPSTNYKFNFFNNIPRIIEPNFHGHIMPKDYFKSCFQVVNESTCNKFMITEKTVIPLLQEMPFVVFGKENFHSYLKKLGFELYDEIFDYSFDCIENIEIRYRTQVEMISKLPKDFNEWKYLKTKIIKKLEHNKNLAIQYSVNAETIPKDIRNLFSEKKWIIFDYLLKDIFSVLNFKY